MTPERWQRVKGVLQDALDRSPADRAGFLDDVCAGDDALRREVESLLLSNDRARSSDFLEQAPPVVRNLASAEHANETLLMAQLSAALGDKYTVERELGAGGMSRVFLAHERALDRHVVAKVLNPELSHHVSAERFAREIRVAARLQQANIVPVHMADQVGGLAYYTMPYAGSSLRERLAAEGSLPAAVALGVLRDIAKALAYAHANGVVHRDIKPENVLISGGTAVVTDFGVAKALSVARTEVSASTPLGSDNITTEGIALGTPAYMSPEQASGDPDVGPRSDVYSFGVVAYELFAGVHPFAGKRSLTELMAAHVLEAPRHVSQICGELPPRLAALVMQCLAKDPGLRFGDGAELLAALDLAAAGPLATSAVVPPPNDVPTVAILPLENLSAPENEYFSDGITAEVQSLLTRRRGLRVAARTSSFAFKGQNADLRVIAESLGVRNVLVGSVRRSGSRVRIDVRLIHAADGAELWKERYDRELSDMFALQEEIAQSIARALEQALSAGGADSETLAGASTRHALINSAAFEIYLRGRQLVEQRKEGMHEALRCFEEAAHIAPDFAASYAGIAYALVEFGIYHALRPRDAFPRAREAAERALVLDPDDALALVMQAHTALWYEWNYPRAEMIARRALDLAPGFYLAHDCLGLVLAAQGRFEEAIAAMEQARSLDPLSEYATYDLAWILILAGKWDQALRALEPAVARHPQASELHRAFGFCLLYTGRVQEARAEFARVLELNAGDRWATPNLVQPLVALGEVAEAQQLLASIEQRAAHEPIPTVGIAIAHHCLGNNDLAIAWLERAIEARDYWLVMLRFDPSMARLRDDARFESLMRRVAADAAHVS